MTILRKRAQHDDLQLPDEEPLRWIAERVHDNVRAIEGALIRVVAFGSLTGRERPVFSTSGLTAFITRRQLARTPGPALGRRDRRGHLPQVRADGRGAPLLLAHGADLSTQADRHVSRA